MTCLLRIGALCCLVFGSTAAQATKLRLDFEELDCKEKHHYLLECQEGYSQGDPRTVATLYWEIASALEDPATSYNLARYMYTQVNKGAAITTDEDALLNIVAETARLGHAPAQVTFGRYLQSPQGGDVSRALHYFLEAHKQGDLTGTLHAGKIYYDWGWYKAAFPLLEKAAHNGDPDAQYLTGVMLGHGLKDVDGGLWSYLGSFVDVGKSARTRAARPEAITWLEKARKQNHPFAEEILLELYAAKNSEEKATYDELMALARACDISKTSLYDSKNRWDAIAYYQKAARLAAQADDFGREAEARYQSGIILNKPYLEGDKVHFQWKRMHDAAYGQFSLAASLGHSRAQWCLEALETERCLDPLLVVNMAAISVQQMCGVLPEDRMSLQALYPSYCAQVGPQVPLLQG